MSAGCAPAGIAMPQSRTAGHLDPAAPSFRASRRVTI